MTETRGQMERAIVFIESLTPPDNWQGVVLAFMRMLDEKEAEVERLRAYNAKNGQDLSEALASLERIELQTTQIWIRNIARAAIAKAGGER